MHGELHFADNILAACDAFPWKEVKNDTGVQLCINYSDDAEAAAVFKKLAAGGKISMSFEKQFWNSSLGKLTDKFEKIWMIASEAV